MFDKKEYDRQWALANAEKRKEYSRRYKLNNPEKVKERAKKYREENREKRRKQSLDYYYSNRDEILEKRSSKALWNKYRHKRQSTDPALYIWTHVKARAKRRDQEFTITPEDIVIPETCPLLGIPLKFGTRTDTDASPSLDRMDNSKGYVPGNVWVISNKANRMKSAATIPELVLFSKSVLKLFGQENV